MNILKNILILIIVILLLSSCQLDTTKEVYIHGYNLEEMELNIIQKDEMSFKDVNGPYKIYPGFGITNDLNSLNSPIKEGYSTKGNISIIYGYFQDNNAELYTLPIKYLQGFKKAELILINHFALINSKPYQYSELKNNLIYEDERWIVYDITEYLSESSINNKINNLNKKLNIEHSWLIAPFYYLDDHLSKLISNKDSKDLTYINNQIKFIIPGYSLKEMGLEFNVRDDISFLDPNNSKSKPHYIITNSDVTIPITIIHEKENYSLYGNFSMIELSFSDGHLDMNQLPVKYIQGFRKEEVTNNQNFAEINSKLYSFKALEKNVVYEDVNWVVFEISDYLDTLDIDSKLKIISDNNSFNYDFDWLKKMYDYLDKHLDEMITR